MSTKLGNPRRTSVRTVRTVLYRGMRGFGPMNDVSPSVSHLLREYLRPKGLLIQTSDDKSRWLMCKLCTPNLRRARKP